MLRVNLSMSVNRNKRLAWISQQIAECKSNATIIRECMQIFPGISEKTARADLKELMERMTEIEMENLPEAKTKHLELAFRILDESLKLGQLGPAANMWKNMAVVMGLANDKDQTTNSTNSTSTPEADKVRARIAELMRKKSVRDAAKEANIDLDAMKDKKDKK
jgi:hypothetical protein